MSRFRTHAASCFLIAVLCAIGNVRLAYGQTAFFDDFQDGSATDGMPVTWRQHGHGPDGAWTVVDGDYVAKGINPNVSETMGTQATDVIFSDAVSAQAKATILEGAGNLALKVRGSGDGFFLGYGASIDSTGNAFLFRLEGNATTTPPIVLSLTSGLGFTSNDEVNLRLDAVGSELRFTVWPEGSERPTTPTLVANDAAFPQGAVGFAFAEALSAPNSTALFHEFRAVVIPEPSTLPLAGLSLLAVLPLRRRRTTNTQAESLLH